MKLPWTGRYRSLDLNDDLGRLWRDADPFEIVMNLEGQAVREVAERSTIRVELGARVYYVKRHFGVGWKEIFKNLLTFKRPVVDAGNEYHAMRELEAAGLHVLRLAGFGCKGLNPATRRSFLMTEELTGVTSLEQVCLRWPEQPPHPVHKRVLIERVAEIARRMHQQGFVHQDFYICHLLLSGAVADDAERFSVAPIHLVDLHRAQRYRKIPTTALVKDLGGLYYSTFEIGLTRRDVYRFLQGYFDCPLREVMQSKRDLLRLIDRRARNLFIKARKKGILPRQLAGLDGAG